jgi:jasmonate ZIM domain-containing protein
LACGVLSRCVRAKAAAAGETAADRPASTPAAASSTMLLLPGADVAPDVREEEEPEASTPAPAPAPAQLTIMYGGRVLVFDDVPADRAAELLHLAAASAGAKDDIPVARKASLQRFMEKRRERLAAQAPYDAASRPTTTLASEKRQQEGHAGAWLGLGIPGGCVR